MSDYADIIRRARMLWEVGAQPKYAIKDICKEYAGCEHIHTILYPMLESIKNITGTWGLAFYDMTDILEGKQVHYISRKRYERIAGKEEVPGDDGSAAG